MFVIGATLAIACSLGWASADVLRKDLPSDAQPLRLSIQLAATQLGIIQVTILMPFEVDGWSAWFIGADYWQYAVPSFICTAIGHVLFLEALKASELSFTIPFLSFSPIFVMALAILILGEWPSVIACIGVFVVALGTIGLEGVHARRGKGPLSPDEQRSYRRGRNLMVLTAAFWSCAAALDKGALSHSSALTHLVLLLGSIWVLLMTYERVFGHRTSAPSSPKTSIFQGQWQKRWVTCAVMVISMALQLAAYRYWDVAYVESIKRALGLICSVCFGALLFRETNAVHRLPAVIAMAIGSVLVLLG